MLRFTGYHRGILDNEKVDSLAKQSLLLLDHFLLCKCHYFNLFSKFKTIVKNQATDTVKSESLFKGTKYFRHIQSALSIPRSSTKPQNFFRDLCLLYLE